MGPFVFLAPSIFVDLFEIGLLIPARETGLNRIIDNCEYELFDLVSCLKTDFFR